VGRRYELVDGVLVEMPPESGETNTIAKILLFELAKHFPIALLGHKDVVSTKTRSTAVMNDLSPR
jgi:Uma2 family endonuclease